jgi:MYXO-CTERM domain-containing protein
VVHVPRNAVFITVQRSGAPPDWDPIPIDNEVPFTGLVYENHEFWTAAEPLAPGTAIPVSTSTTTYEVDEVIDVTPPSRPTVEGGEVTFHRGTTRDGCSTTESSCGDYTDVTIDIVQAEDEHTPQGQLTYAVYVGYTAEEARQEQEITHLLFPSPTLWTLTLEPLSAADVYVAVSAIDMAGNESERSEPVKINDQPKKDDGCTVSRPSPSSSTLALLGLALAGLLVRRLRRRRC